MRTPEEIKQGLRHCAGDCCEGCNYESVCYGADWRGGFTALSGDALRYIQRLETELIATRVQLAKDGDLCHICKAQRAQDCVGDCIGCDNTECCCKRCIDTDGKEGFEWDGGRQNE